MNKPIKQIIQSIIPEQHRWKFELFKEWDAIIGHMKNNVIIEKIDGETLYLCAKHPVWAQELLLLTPVLKEKINVFLPANTIKTIRINNKKSPQPFFQNQRTQHHQRTIETKHEHITLTPQEKQLLAPLASHELQLCMGSYLIRCKKIAKGGR